MSLIASNDNNNNDDKAEGFKINDAITCTRGANMTPLCQLEGRTNINQYH